MMFTDLGFEALLRVYWVIMIALMLATILILAAGSVKK
jgi:hypothetical protein